MYDTKNATVVAQDDRSQSFTYALPGDPPRNVTIGSSDASQGQGFQIAQMTQTTLDPITDIPDRGIFPLAQSFDAAGAPIMYYLVESYDDAGRARPGTKLATLVAGDLRIVAALDGQVSTGTVANDRLWFTTYQQASDTYDLNSLPLRDLTGEPRSERRGLVDDALTALGGRLIVGGVFSARTGRLDCSIYCLPDQSTQRVYRLGNNDSGDLFLEVVDIQSGQRKSLTTGEIIDVELLDTGVKVYLNGSVQTYTGNEVE